MAITDLRFAASLLKDGFSADEIRQIIGLKEPKAAADTEAAEPKENENKDLNVLQIKESEPDPEDTAPDPEGTEPEPGQIEQDPKPAEPDKPKENPLTRNENPKKESLIDELAKLL